MHPFTGQPRIPGSAVKGVARHAAWRLWDEETEPVLKKTMALSVAEIFGFPTLEENLDAFLKAEIKGYDEETHHAGSVIFLDAHPLERAKLVEDILTPHNTEKGPIPNVFPAVETGTTFVFALLPGRRMAGFDSDKRDSIWEMARCWVLEALTEDCIGAKTSAGYGWFEENPAIAERMAREARDRREREKQEKAEARAFGRVVARGPLHARISGHGG